MTDNSPNRKSSLAGSASFSTKASRRQTQLLCRESSSATSLLRQAVLAHQGMNDPGFFPISGPPAGLIQAQDGRLGQALIDLQGPYADGLETENLRGGQALETIEDLVGLLAEADDQRCLLPIATQGLGHGGLGLGVRQAIAAILLAELVDGHNADIAGKGVCHGVPRDHAPKFRARKRGTGRPARPLPPRFWGAGEIFFCREWRLQECDDMNRVAGGGP